MMLASNDKMNDKISVVLHMGPVAFPHWFKGYFLKQQALIRSDQVSHDAQLAMVGVLRCGAYGNFCYGIS